MAEPIRECLSLRSSQEFNGITETTASCPTHSLNRLRKMNCRTEQGAGRAEAHHRSLQGEDVHHLPGIASFRISGECSAAIGQRAGQAARERSHGFVAQIGLVQQRHAFSVHAEAEHFPEAETGHPAEKLFQQGIARGVAGIEHCLLKLEGP